MEDVTGACIFSAQSVLCALLILTPDLWLQDPVGGTYSLEPRTPRPDTVTAPRAGCPSLY